MRIYQHLHHYWYSIVGNCSCSWLQPKPKSQLNTKPKPPKMASWPTKSKRHAMLLSLQVHSSWSYGWMMLWLRLRSDVVGCRLLAVVCWLPVAGCCGGIVVDADLFSVSVISVFILRALPLWEEWILSIIGALSLFENLCTFCCCFFCSLILLLLLSCYIVLLSVSVFRPCFNTWLALEPCWHVTS